MKYGHLFLAIKNNNLLAKNQNVILIFFFLKKKVIPKSDESKCQLKS